MFPDIQGRIRIENISEFLFTGPEAPEQPADSDETRALKLENRIHMLLKTALPGENVEDMIGDEIFDTLNEVQSLYFEQGLCAGAALVFELLGLRRSA